MTPELRALAKPVLFMAGLLLAGLGLRLLQQEGGFEPAAVARLVGAAGIPGEALFVLLGGLACAVGMPRQAVAFAGGYVFGLGHGLAASLSAMVLGLCLAFWWARLVGRSWASRRIGGRLARLDRFIAENPFSATLTLRLLPVGNNLALNLLAGLSGVAFAPFLAGSALGYLPQTVVFALLGSGVAVERGVQVALGVGLFAVSAGLGLWLLARHRRARALAEASGLSG